MDTKQNTEHLQFYTQEDLLEPVIYALKDDDVGSVRILISALHPADVAELLNILDTESRAKIVDILGAIDPETLPYLENEVKDEIISFMGAKHSAEAIDELEIDEAIQFMEELSEENTEEILRQMPEDKRVIIEETLALPEDSAGRLSNSKYVGIPENWTVGQALDFIRASDNLPDDFHTVFVLDAEKRPLSWVPVSRILRSNEDVKISDVAETKLITFTQEQDQEETAYIFRKYNLISAPVVDKDGRIDGVISLDDIADVMEEEAEEDLLKLSGVGGGDSDFYANPMKVVKNRSPWLMVNLVCSMGASFVISLFEVEIKQLMALAVLMPLVATMSGNMGTQSLAVAVRALATKELNINNFYRFTRKEMTAACLNGLLFGAVIAIGSFVFYHSFMLSFTILMAVFLTFTIGALIGSVAPLMIQKMGFDPAVAGTPFVFAVTDSSSFFIFLGLASMMLM
jgi:magnesium transporter